MIPPSLGEGKGVGLHRNLPRPIATVEVTVIDHAELTWSNALHPTVGMHPVTTVTKVLGNTNKIVGCMPHLESNLLRKGGRYLGQPMKILDHELLFTGCCFPRLSSPHSTDRHPARVPCAGRWCGTNVPCAYPAPYRYLYR